MITFKAKNKSGEIVNSGLNSMGFPAGERHIKLAESRHLEPTEIAVVKFDPHSMHDDLFDLAMWEDFLLDSHPDAKRVVVMPYLPGARADRGAPFGAQVYARFLASMNIDQLIAVDPHSPVFLNEYRHLQPSVEVTTVYSDEIIKDLVGMDTYTGVIAPDKGAVERTQKVADALGVPMYRAGKTRDEATGHLSGFHMEDEHPSDGTYLLVDDICDGGGTFLGLAKATGLRKHQLHLWVTHGVFSGKALYSLPEAFGTIYTTNSYNPKRNLNLDPDEDYAFVRFGLHTIYGRIK